MLFNEKKVKLVNKKLIKFIDLINNVLDYPNIFENANKLSIRINQYAYSLDILLNTNYNVHISSHGIVIYKNGNEKLHITEEIRKNTELNAKVYRKAIYVEYELRKAVKELLKEFTSPGHIEDYTSTSFPNIKSTFNYNIVHVSKTINTITIE